MNDHRSLVSAAVIRYLAALGGAGILLAGVMVPRAGAAIGAGADLTWPATVAVGIPFNASVTVFNASAPSQDESIVLTGLLVTPACADSSTLICLAPNLDPGTFDILSAVGDTSTAPCNGVTFTVGAPILPRGEVPLTPTTTITLGPAAGPFASRTCRVNLTLRAKRLPSNPADGVPGTTEPIAVVTLQGVTSGLNGTASGNTRVTVVFVPVEFTTQPNPSEGIVLQTALGDVATLSGGGSLTGTLTFRLFGPDDQICVGDPIFVSVVPVNGGGSYASGIFPARSVAQPGVYNWTAEYSGDTSNGGAVSACGQEPVTIRAATTAVPTLSTWGMVLFTILLVAIGSVMLRRRRIGRAVV